MAHLYMFQEGFAAFIPEPHTALQLKNAYVVVTKMQQSENLLQYSATIWQGQPSTEYSIKYQQQKQVSYNM